MDFQVQIFSFLLISASGNRGQGIWDQNPTKIIFPGEFESKIQFFLFLLSGFLVEPVWQRTWSAAFCQLLRGTEVGTWHQLCVAGPLLSKECMCTVWGVWPSLDLCPWRKGTETLSLTLLSFLHTGKELGFVIYENGHICWASFFSLL